MSSLSVGVREASRKSYRSWGEAQIARMFERYGVPFTYEQPAAVFDGERTRIWYPDFFLRGQGIFLEYRGREHDPAYDEGMARKEAVYTANGLTVLTVTPEVFRGNWPTRILDQVEEVQADRLASFRALRRQPAGNYRLGRWHGCERYP
jgi:hypothetical protein